MTATDNPNTTQRFRIQNYLTQLAKGGVFYAVRYNPETGLAEDIGEGSQAIEPSYAGCRETGSRFESDTRMGRVVAQRRSSWTFELQIRFNGEATIEAFERQITSQVPILRSIDATHPAAIMRLVATSIIHPPEQQPATGTSVTMIFAVEDGRN